MDNSERTKLIVRERGYIVLTSPAEHKVGEIIQRTHDKGPLPQPFVIIGKTSFDDAMEQHLLLVKNGDCTEQIPTNREGWSYYRLTTD